MTTLDRRQDPSNHVLHQLNHGDPATATLIVDRKHLFFFDHPLDHVPGLLLLEGAVQLAQSMAESSQFVSSISASFDKYALFERDIELSADSVAVPEGRRHDITITQDGKVRAHVSVGLAVSEDEPQQKEYGGVHLEPCSPTPLNKVNPENVLITTPQVTAATATAQILPVTGKCLLTDSAGAVHPLHLLECFMQMQRYLNAQQSPSRRMRDILTGVTFSQQRPIRDKSAPMTIDGDTNFFLSRNGKATRTATIRASGTNHARCTIVTARTGTLRKSA